MDPAHSEHAPSPEGKVLRLAHPFSASEDAGTAAAIGALLPEGGLYRGAVIEISSPRGLARATSLALSACAAAQAEAHSRAHGYCAWIDGSLSLHAPAVERAGVDRQRLLVVRPFSEGENAAQAFSRVAVRVVASHAFSLVVVDTVAHHGSLTHAPNATAVRRLALAAEHSDTTVLLLTDLWAPRAQALPVAMRLEIERPADDKLWVRVAKDRYGRVTPKTPVPLAPPRGVRSTSPDPSTQKLAG